MITLNDPKLFTRSKSRRKRAQHEREGSKNATKVVHVVVKKEGAFVDPIRGALFPRGRERRACVCSLLFSITYKIGAALVQRKAKRGVQIRDTTTQKKKETTTTPPKRNAPPVIDDDVLHRHGRAAGGVGEHLFSSRSGVSKKGTWCSDDVFDAFY